MMTFAAKIAARQFVVTTELTPPKGVDVTDLLEKADALRGLADAINLTESPRARKIQHQDSRSRVIGNLKHAPS